MMEVDDVSKASPGKSLSKETVHPNPIEQFRSWYEEALGSSEIQPTAVTLATATPAGRPSARVVLLKDVSEAGFVFFTNYESRKGRELHDNPWAALVCYWASLERQVRIEGRVSLISSSESDIYFQTRQAGSQLSTWVSRQSVVIPSRDVLERRMQEVMAKYPKGHVPRPPYWGGYRVAPIVIEFWQGRPNRLHDRIRYTRTEDNIWQIQRLAP
jgi:pyridoxamine 5'-phosphate oxidase